MTTRAEWEARAQRLLPDEGRIVERNAAISGTYASWYREHPELFKWAGMAAFGSHRVGLALSPFRATRGNGRLARLLRRDPFVFDDLELFRQTNNRIYADIGWLHLAYIDDAGGMAAVEAELAGDEERRSLLEGFRAIDKGRAIRRASGNDTEADALVWRGNLCLLEHEQRRVVQRYFDKLDPAFDVFLSLTTTLDFDADNLCIDFDSHASFYAYMLTYGLRLLGQTRRLPDYTRFDHRWFWLERRVFPLWRGVERTDSSLRRHVDALIARGRA